MLLNRQTGGEGRSSHEDTWNWREGQGLSSRGRWEPQFRKCPEDDRWARVSRIFIHTAETQTSVELLLELAHGRLEKVFRSRRSWSVRSGGAVTNELEERGGFPPNRTTEDRETTSNRLQTVGCDVESIVRPRTGYRRLRDRSPCGAPRKDVQVPRRCIPIKRRCG